MTLLSVDRLTVRHVLPEGAVTALDDVSLDVSAGERLAVIGESGSGKTTLARSIAGILPATARTSGAIRWQGLPRPPRPGCEVGLVLQDPAASLDPVMAVGMQIAEVAHAHCTESWSEARVIAIDLLGRVGLPATLAYAFPHQLSGGQKQRVALAAALAARPRLLIADEATSALDTVVQADVVALLDRLVRTEGLSLIFISHDIALASQLVDRIAVFKDARLIEIGTTESVLTRPRSSYTRLLIEAHLGIEA